MQANLTLVELKHYLVLNTFFSTFHFEDQEIEYIDTSISTYFKLTSISTIRIQNVTTISLPFKNSIFTPGQLGHEFLIPLVTAYENLVAKLDSKVLLCRYKT